MDKEGKQRAWERCVEFHGHVCPGLAIGFKAAETGLEVLKDLSTVGEAQSQIVSIVQNDACGVDAVQVLTGCTFGKGNLFFQDHGKQVLTFVYFVFNRWSYNALDSGEESAKALGVNVEKTRFLGMFFSSLITATVVSFLGVIGFIGLVAPHMIRRLIGGDHRFLIPAAGVMGAFLLLASDTLARRIIAPIVLPVGAVTSFLGAPLFLYLLARGYRRG